ncbi:hypothetical protein [Methylobacterium sp. WL103]|nr:hypothetical protein [Methylobacterium sp. WL103]
MLEAGMRRVMDLIDTCVTVAWWDGSCLGLRLHRLPDLIDRVASAPQRVRRTGARA